MAKHPRFDGNCPHNVSRDAKYSVRSGKRGQSVVGLMYRSSNREMWYATTEDHPRLAEMVNAVKVNIRGVAKGAFYINEYKQVLVPIGDNPDYYLAGTYEGELRFSFEGKILSGEPIDFEGRKLQPGDIWEGPHPGIPYKLCAGGTDIAYTAHPRPRVTREVRLSDEVGREKALVTAKKISAVKGHDGGRFYVNEWGTMFAPVSEGSEWRYLYIGQLEPGEPWFAMRKTIEDGLLDNIISLLP